MDNNFSLNTARSMDTSDPLYNLRKRFNIPMFKGEEAIYFTGNSLGLQLKNHSVYLDQELKDWQSIGVDGHFKAKTPWFDYHKCLEKSTSTIVGAKKKEVVTMNGLSVNLHLLLTSFYQPTKQSYKILCEPHLFPSDLYILQSQIQLKGYNPKDALVFLPSGENGVVAEDDIYKCIEDNKDQLAMIFIGGVNYYTGQVFNLEKITALGHKYDILVGFDLAHAAGNIELKLHEWEVDFAAWCSYKYLNSGPGNVATIFVHEHQIKKNPFRLSGWWGHTFKNRFSLQTKFKPIKTAEGWQLSNAPIFGMSIYRASLDLFDEIGMKKLIHKRINLSIYLEQAIHSFNKKSTDLKMKIITPGSAENRGGQLSVLISKNGKDVYNFLRNSGVYVDWREPNVMRLAVAPLYNSFEDIARFYKLLLNAFKK